jgi:hypothetical protein
LASLNCSSFVFLCLYHEWLLPSLILSDEGERT